MDIRPEHHNFNGVGPVKYTRDLPPAHFTFKVQSLSNAQEERYESGEFESGGYNWRLSIYPTGDKTRNGTGYISLYLSMSETSALPLGEEVLVNYKLFVFDQLRGNYLTVHDNPGDIRRFSHINKEWGFAQLISLDTFKEASSGYLVGDSCIFGAEVLVIKYSSKSECLCLDNEPNNKTYTWKISNFSSLPNDKQYSEVFKVGNFNWRLVLYSEGKFTVEPHLSLYLKFLDLRSLPPKGNLYAVFALRIRDEVNGHHYERQIIHRFHSSEEDWGYGNFLPLNDLNNAAKGYLIGNTIILEVEFLAMPQIEYSS